MFVISGDCDLELSNHEDRTPLMLAVEMDDIRMIRRLIKAGMTVPSLKYYQENGLFYQGFD